MTLSLLLPACDPPDDPGETEDVTATIGATSVVSTSGSESDGSGSGSASGSASGTGMATTGGVTCEPLPVDGFACADDSDCEIAGDCCSCVAYNPMMGAPGNCGGSCEQTVCEQLDVNSAYCDAGTCRVRGLSCNQTTVICEVEPPECDDGHLPQVSDGCFTGGCLPVEYCDWVPDCSACPTNEHCIRTETPGCDQHQCIPDFPECPPGPPTCDCLGPIVCNPPYGTCSMDGDVLVCS